jgi:hypothetical protein
MFLTNLDRPSRISPGLPGCSWKILQLLLLLVWRGWRPGRVGSGARDGLSFRRWRTTPAGCRRTMLLRPRAVHVGETADSRTLSPPAEETSPTPERPQGARRNAAAPIRHPVLYPPNQRRRLVYSKGEPCTNPNRVQSQGRRLAPVP